MNSSLELVIPTPNELKDPLGAYQLNKAVNTILSAHTERRKLEPTLFSSEQLQALTVHFSRNGWKLETMTEIDHARISHLREYPPYWNDQEDFIVPAGWREQQVGLSDEQIAEKHNAQVTFLALTPLEQVN